MNFKFTLLISSFVAIILAVGVKIGYVTGCYYSTLYISRPCSIINLCIFLFVVAFVVDFYIGIITPRTKNYLSNKTKKLVLIKEDNIRDSVFTDSYKGFYSGVGIRVFNKSDIEVSECFGTLEELHIVIIKNGKLKELPNSSDVIGMKVSKKLLWANIGVEDTSCKANIPAKSKENVILVAGIFDELVFEKKKE